jgi:hypothetical protein
MLKRARLAALAMVCALATAAKALPPITGGGEEFAGSERIGPLDPDASRLSFSEAGPGIRLTNEAAISDIGIAQVRRGIVGSVAIAKGVEVGLGLLSVSRYSRGEPSLRRLQPMRDVTGRDQRIAAVGVSLRF